MLVFGHSDKKIQKCRMKNLCVLLPVAVAEVDHRHQERVHTAHVQLERTGWHSLQFNQGKGFFLLRFLSTFFKLKGSHGWKVDLAHYAAIPIWDNKVLFVKCELTL